MGKHFYVGVVGGGVRSYRVGCEMFQDAKHWQGDFEGDVAIYRVILLDVTREM